ncbi:MAG: caspase family protein [Neomegalonema sp.]|nr:caspase family protein [Neomegalonema sp.]
MIRRFSLVATLTLSMTAMAAEAAAKVVSVVVGVNEYRHIRKLDGAVADAKHIASAARLVGGDVTVLLDRAATRASVTQAWKEALAKASKGDLIILAFAGHGVRIADKNGDEGDDAHDEALAFAGFDANSPAGAREMMLDDEIDAWLDGAAAKGVQVLLVVDACYSGDMTRSFGRPQHPAYPPHTRSGGDFDLPAGFELPPAAALAPRPAAETRTNVLFLAAAAEDRPSVETPIKGAYRGALSYAVASAFEAMAKKSADGPDSNGDGRVTKGEFESYVLRIARHYGGHSDPTARPRGDAGRVLLEAPTKTTASDAPTAPRPIKIRAIGAELPPLKGATPAAEGEVPDLIWNAPKQEIRGADGDLYAQKADAAALQAIVAKFRIIEMVKQKALDAPAAVAVDREGAGYYEGEQLTLSVGPIAKPYITLFNLANTGEVQPIKLYAHERGALEIGLRHDFGKIQVGRPFGADHVVVIESSKPPAELRAALEAKVSAAELAPILAKLMQQEGVRVGLQPIFTSRLEFK